MDRDYLGDEAYKFYAKFKEHAKNGIISEVIIGSKERKIKIRNGKDLEEYNGSQGEARKLTRRIYRNFNQDNNGALFVTIIKNNRDVKQFYKEWDIKRLRYVLNHLKGKNLISDFNITEFKN